MLTTWKCLLLATTLAFVSTAKAVDVISQAKPYRVSVTEHRPFAANKAYSISFNRIYMDARPLVAVQPILPQVDSEFDADLYSCLSKQVIQLTQHFEADKKTYSPKNIFIGVKQFDGKIMEALCRPSLSVVTDNSMVMQTCYAPRYVEKESQCQTMSSSEIASGLKYYHNEPQKRDKALSDLKSSSNRLLEVLSRK